MNKWIIFVVIAALALIAPGCSDDKKTDQNEENIQTESSAEKSESETETKQSSSEIPLINSDTATSETDSQKPDTSSKDITENQSNQPDTQSRTDSEKPDSTQTESKQQNAESVTDRDKPEIKQEEADDDSTPYADQANPILDMKDTDAFIYLLAASEGVCDKQINYSKEACDRYIKKVMNPEDRWYHIISHYKILAKHFFDQRIYKRMHKELKKIRSANADVLRKQYGLKISDNN